MRITAFGAMAILGMAVCAVLLVRVLKPETRPNDKNQPSDIIGGVGFDRQ